jgi:hypothetical protein
VISGRFPAPSLRGAGTTARVWAPSPREGLGGRGARGLVGAGTSSRCELRRCVEVPSHGRPRPPRSLDSHLSHRRTGSAQRRVARGLSTAIMDAWCAVAGGEWAWRPTPAGGVQVAATFGAVA